MFDWLLFGEVSPEIGEDFFVQIKHKNEFGFNDIDLVASSSILHSQLDYFNGNGSSIEINNSNKLEEFEWRCYKLASNDGFSSDQIPVFMNISQIKKIFFIGNAVRLLRYMLKDEYDQRTMNELFQQHHYHIQLNFDTMKRFVYKNFDTNSGSGNDGGVTSGTCGTASEIGTNIGGSDMEVIIEAGCEEDNCFGSYFFFEHPLVDDFNILLDSYYEVINEEMFKLLNLKELR